MNEINLNEAEGRYELIKSEFQNVKKRYSGFFSIYRTNLGKGDDEKLAKCFEDACHLGLESVVQQEAKNERLEETLYNKLGELSNEILDFASRFKNSGVKKLRDHIIPFDLIKQEVKQN